jgi:hypothetical protein
MVGYDLNELRSLVIVSDLSSKKRKFICISFNMNRVLFLFGENKRQNINVNMISAKLSYIHFF